MYQQTIGRYQIISELGRGGMATVYRAFDPLTKRDVALKLLPREFLHNPAFRTRFDQEAHTVAALEHPAIVPIYDYGEDDGQPFLVMRLMTGGTLSDRIKRGALPLIEVARIIGQIAPGLDQAHAIGIIHRDLKPANILFDSYNNPHISDFGLVKLAESSANLTSSGIVGTPKYMAPEMANPSTVTRLVDIYALGVTIFEMATGQTPYDAETPVALLMAHINTPVPDVRTVLPELPERLQAIIEGAMAKNPAARYQSAADLASDLDSLTSASRTGKIGNLRRDATPQLGKADIPRRKGGVPMGLVALAGVIIVAAGLGAGLLFGGALLAPPKLDALLTRTPATVAAATEAPTTVEAAQGLTQSPTEAPSQASTAATSEAPTETATEVSTPPPASTAPKITADNLRELLPIRKLKGHTNFITDVRWSPDGSLLASSSADRDTIVWNPQTGDALKTLVGHSNQVHGIAWSPDGKRLVSASSDRDAIVWNVETGQPAGNPMEPGTYGLADVAWSPDGKTIAVAPFYTQVLLWDLRTDQIIANLVGHVDWVNSLAYSPDGSRLASAGKDGKVILWDPVTGDLIKATEGFQGEIKQIVWSPDGKQIAAATVSKTIVLFDVDTGRAGNPLRGHDDIVNTVAWSPDGTLLATGGLDHKILVWDAATGAVLRRLDGGGGNIMSLQFSPDQTLLAVGNENFFVTLWGFTP